MILICRLWLMIANRSLLRVWRFYLRYLKIFISKRCTFPTVHCVKVCFTKWKIASNSDIRLRTTENLAAKHLVDLEHAAQVKATRAISRQRILWTWLKAGSELFDLLEWSALLHGVGLSINTSIPSSLGLYPASYQHAGFNSEQQLVLSTLVRFQRKALKLNEMTDFSLFKKKHITGSDPVFASGYFSQRTA